MGDVIDIKTRKAREKKTISDWIKSSRGSFTLPNNDVYFVLEHIVYLYRSKPRTVDSIVSLSEPPKTLLGKLTKAKPNPVQIIGNDVFIILIDRDNVYCIDLEVNDTKVSYLIKDGESI